MIIFDEFLHIVASELSVVDNPLSADTEFRKLPVWSSLNALLLISRINDDYGVFISSADLAAIRTLDELYHLIASRLNGTK